MDGGGIIEGDHHLVSRAPRRRFYRVHPALRIARDLKLRLAERLQDICHLGLGAGGVGLSDLKMDKATLKIFARP